jgi:hypothetical protein
MGMVRLFTGPRIFHGIRARHFDTGGAQQRPHDRLVAGFDQVFREQFSIDIHGDTTLKLDDLKFGGAHLGESSRAQDGCRH